MKCQITGSCEVVPTNGLTYDNGCILQYGESKVRNESIILFYFLFDRSEDLFLLVFDGLPFFCVFLRADGLLSFDGAADEALSPFPTAFPFPDDLVSDFFGWAPLCRWAPLEFFEAGELLLDAGDFLLFCCFSSLAGGGFFLELAPSVNAFCTSSRIMTRTILGSTLPSVWMASATRSAVVIVTCFLATFLMRIACSLAATC